MNTAPHGPKTTKEKQNETKLNSKLLIFLLNYLEEDVLIFELILK